ncbi:MAG: Ppx/GppA family phosphatase [Candidatus Desulfofervidaceae bacterium]|nr:Ppx/GppA family phosphatase [Candidatus Desulfofervidaceae bacterium]
MNPCFASIDVGTHTTRLLIAHLDNHILTPVLIQRVITKLGMSFESGYIDEASIKKLIETLKTYSTLMQRYQIQGYQAVGTAVLRKAKNKDLVLHAIHQETGLTLEVIEGKTEAHLTAKGVLSTLEIEEKPLLIADIGGGSTELIWIGENEFVKSLPLGATWLTRSFLKSDPPVPEEVKKAFHAAIEVISTQTSFLFPALLIGTAGTVSTLAAIDLKMTVYQPYLVNGYVLSQKRVEEIFSSLARFPASARTSIPGLEPGREEIILGGTIILLGLLETFKQDKLIVSEGGLLEGILVNYLEKNTGKRNLKFTIRRQTDGDKRSINL